MESPSLPTKNCVGLLQNICAKRKIDLPKYIDCETGSIQYFKFICQLGELSTEGTSNSKKVAKQIAASVMIEKIENQGDLTSHQKKITNDNAVTKLSEYSSKENKNMPMYADIPEEESCMFSVSCKFEDFTGFGKGFTKKAAKEEAALSVAKHFGILQYFENIKKSEERLSSQKNPISRLYELCQIKKLGLFIEEKLHVEDSKTVLYVVSCTVGDLEVSSSKHPSKKMAKTDAANLMLNLLNSDTPDPSPDVPSPSPDVPSPSPDVPSPSPDIPSPMMSNSDGEESLNKRMKFDE